MKDIKKSRTERRFPKVSETLRTVLGTSANGHGSLRQTRRLIAKKLGVNVETVDSWRRGVRCIPEEKIALLVRSLGHELPDKNLTPKGLELVRALKSARESDEPLSWKERVDEGRYILVEQARYAGAGKFWGRLFFSFLDTANVLHSADQRSRNFDELQEAVWSGELDVALGILSTPRLSLKLWFFECPIRYRLNCILLSEVDAIGGVARAKEILTRPTMRKRLFVPIIMKGELGEAYACRTLGLVDPVWVGSLSANMFCRALVNNAGRTDGRIPLMIADEVTCLSALVKLNGRGRIVFPLVPKPLSGRPLIPPSFPLGLCLSRNERVGHAKKGELMSFIRDALPVYIRGNAQYIALSYVALYNKMKRLVGRALPDCPAIEREAWSKRTFCLDPDLMNLESPHWRAVLREAMLTIHGEGSFI